MFSMFRSGGKSAIFYCLHNQQKSSMSQIHTKGKSHLLMVPPVRLSKYNYSKTRIYQSPRDPSKYFDYNQVCLYMIQIFETIMYNFDQE